MRNTGLFRKNCNKSVFIEGSCFSHGKLLITAEYLILRGAMGLALPLRLGQEIKWRGRGEGIMLEWVTKVRGKMWFCAVFRGSGYSVVSATDSKKAAFLREILVNAARLSLTPEIFGRVECSVNFDMEWGMGSSSSLLSNVAYLFDVNPFALHFAVSNGSGYDIACARSDSPIRYRLEFHDTYHDKGKESTGDPGGIPVPVYSHVSFSPPFRNKLYFAWTGRKKDSAIAIENFLATSTISENDLYRVSRITSEIIMTTDIDDFTRLLTEHDQIISVILNEIPVNEDVFKDFKGYVKSLGSWGGDFVMIVWDQSYDELLTLLKPKGINVVFPYEKLI